MTSGTGPSSRISSATVPWPAMTAASLNGWTSVRPVSCEQLVEPLERVGRVRGLLVDRRAVAARGRDLRLVAPCHMTTSASSACLARGPGDRLRVVAGRDRDHAARSLLVASAPRCRLSTPRALNEPVRWKSSALIAHSRPSCLESVVRAEQRRAMDAARDRPRGALDVLEEITRERLRARAAWRQATVNAGAAAGLARRRTTVPPIASVSSLTIASPSPVPTGRSRP